MGHVASRKRVISPGIGAVDAARRRLHDGLDYAPHLDWMRQTISRAEAMVPMFDPTAYLDGGRGRLADQKALVDAAIRMRQVAERIAGKEK